MATILSIKALVEQNEFEFKLIDDRFLSVSPLNEKIYIRFGWYDLEGKNELTNFIKKLARETFNMSFDAIYYNYQHVNKPGRVYTEDGVFMNFEENVTNLQNGHYDCIAFVEFVEFDLTCDKFFVIIHCVEWVYPEPLIPLVYPNKNKRLETELSDVKKELADLKKMFKDILGLVDQTNEDYVEAKSRFEQMK